MPKLYNYAAKKFDIHDVMGVFERDEAGNLAIIQSQDSLGKSVNIDQGGNTVNNKGYIINERGDVCNRIGTVIFTTE